MSLANVDITQAAAASIDRYVDASALAFSVVDGGKGRRRLRFDASDAEAMLEALLDAARDADEEDEPHNRNALLEAAAAVWEACR